jgi:hypothetical protein
MEQTESAFSGRHQSRNSLLEFLPRHAEGGLQRFTRKILCVLLCEPLCSLWWGLPCLERSRSDGDSARNHLMSTGVICRSCEPVRGLLQRAELRMRPSASSEVRRPVARYFVMTNAVFHSAFGMFSAAMLWGGLAVAAAVFAILLISESNSGVRPPGCQRGVPARPKN